MPPKRKAVEDTENIKKSKNMENKFNLVWSTHQDTLAVLSSDQLKPRDKVLAFDMDDTLITPKSKGKFPKSRSDWMWLDGSVVKKLQDSYADGYKIVIFTNQAGVEKKKTSLSDIQGKILDLIDIFDFPLQAFVACATDIHRKPNSTMWEIFSTKYNGDITIKESTYIGDAAGRPAGWKSGLKKDFSCSDRKFALNSGIPFKIPEEFFHGERPHSTFDWDGPDPTKLWNLVKDNSLPKNIVVTTPEMVITVGAPASGKSTFSEKHFVSRGYISVNRDTLSTIPKCIKAARDALESGNSVVIDNTNPSSDARGAFIELAKEMKVPVRAFVFKIDPDLNEHLNIFRERTKNIRRIPDVAYGMYKKNFEHPSSKEGISEVVTVDFVPHFDSDDEKKYFFHRA
jgi:bifunctional polynucleotide phosphatase/kinase